jgi:nicotinamidase-related amidase
VSRELRRLEPGSTALIVVECQGGVVGESSMLPELAEQAGPILPIISTLAAGARRAGVTVVHANFEPIPGVSERPTNPLFENVLSRTSGWKPGSPEVTTVPEIGVGEGDLLLSRHHGLSPARGTELLPVLRGLGIETVVVTGVSLNIAVTSVVLDAVNEGFRAVVPRDAVAGTPKDYAEDVLRYTLAMLATLTTSDALLTQWR